MKTSLAYREVESGNLGESATFGFKAGGKAFRVIIDGMYSNKPQSITREIWSNAFDAHSMSGMVDKPFKVTFPHTFDASFRCRDYGPGMDHQFMMTRYTVAFDSTKEDTNDAVGFLGIGRLSPFSYTDTYSVTTYTKGVVRYYSIYLLPDGSPSISLMGEEKTGEPDGTEVSFPVDRVDHRAFREAANTVALGFDVKPTCNMPDFEGWPELEGMFDGKGWRKYKGVYGLLTGAHAKMGCVLYPIKNVFDYGTTEYQLISSNIIIDFKIGDLAVVASREGLSYGKNEPTTNSIKTKLAQIVSDLEADTLRGIKEAPDEWTARRLFGSTNYLPSTIVKSVRSKASWTNIIAGGMSEYLKVPATLHVAHYGDRQLNMKSLPFTHAVNITCQENCIFVVEEKEKAKRDLRGPRRILNWYQSFKPQDKPDRVVLFRVDDDNRWTTMAWIKGVAPCVPVVYVKHMPDPGAATRRPGGGTRAKVTCKSYSCVSDRVADVDMTAEEFKGGGVYVRTRRNEVEGLPAYRSVLHALYTAGTVTPELIMVPAAYHKKFKAASNWIELGDAKDKFVESVGKGTIMKIGLRWWRREDSYAALEKLPVSPGTPLIDTYHEYTASAKAPDKATKLTPQVAHHLVDVPGLLAHKMKTIQNKVKKKMRKEILDTYPLLKYAQSGSDTGPWDEYVQLIDKK